MSQRSSSSEQGPAKTLGFGFAPARSPHHFAVLPRGERQVDIVERFAYGDEVEEAVTTETTKVTLSPYLWDRISGPAENEFNRRLRAGGLRAGRWLKGETLLAPHFGKELTLLAWAVENQDLDPTPIPSMIANWAGLAPEERWWFYTTINATSAHAGYGKDKGWRQAIKIAFAENPVQLPSSALLVGPMPERRAAPRRAGSKTKQTEGGPTQGQLWGDGNGGDSQ